MPWGSSRARVDAEAKPVDRLDPLRVGHLDIDRGGVQIRVPQKCLRCPQIGGVTDLRNECAELKARQ
jgi:hypothetical protein